MKETNKEIEEREKYLGKLFKVFAIIIVVGFIFAVPSYFELHIIFNFLFLIFVGFGLAGMFITLIQPDGISKSIISMSKENKSTKKIISYPYQRIIEKLLKKEEGWITELDSLQKELTEKTLHILQEDNKRRKKHIKVLEEMRELLRELKK